MEDWIESVWFPFKLKVTSLKAQSSVLELSNRELSTFPSKLITTTVAISNAPFSQMRRLKHLSSLIKGSPCQSSLVSRIRPSSFAGTMLSRNLSMKKVLLTLGCCKLWCSTVNIPVKSSFGYVFEVLIQLWARLDLPVRCDWSVAAEILGILKVAFLPIFVPCGC